MPRKLGGVQRGSAAEGGESDDKFRSRAILCPSQHGPGPMTLLHIDTDLGVDDALALFVAARIPAIRIAAISTVFGNVPLAMATRNARLMRQVLPLEPELPIFAGAGGPFGGGAVADATEVHGEDGLGGATASIEPGMLAAMARPAAVDGDLAACIAAGPPKHIGPGDKVVLVGLGPATNIPALAKWYGDAVSEIILLSGAFFDRGNMPGDAEFNAACDPLALAATLALGVEVTMVPLDLCHKIILTHETIRQWPVIDPSAATSFLAAAHEHYVGEYRAAEGIDGCFPHDSIAVLAAFRPEPFFAVQGSVKVEATGRTRLSEVGAGNAKVLTGGELGWVRKGFLDLRF